MSSLQGKKAVIVGGTGDIGLAAARILVDRGAEVIITGREQERAETRARELGPNGSGRQANPADEADLQRFFSEVGEFDYLLVTLGLQAASLPFQQTTDQDFQEGLEGKLFFYTRTLRAAWGKVRESVTWLTGASGRAASPGLSNYGATCGAVHGAMGALVMELAPVRINCVAAGLTKTDFWAKLGMPQAAREAMYQNAARVLPTGYVAVPEDIAEALVFAATNRYTTGTIMDTSGGAVLGRTDPEDGNGKSILGGQSQRYS